MYEILLLKVHFPFGTGRILQPYLLECLALVYQLSLSATFGFGSADYRLTCFFLRTIRSSRPLSHCYHDCRLSIPG